MTIAPRMATPKALVRRARLSWVAVAIFAELALAGCSSLPKGSGQVETVKNEAAAYAAQGNTAYASGDYVRAERFFKEALDTNFSVDNRPGVATSYNSLGRVYLAAQDYKAATTAFDRGEQYAQPAKTAALRSIVMASRTGKAEILLVQGEYEAALEALQKAEGLEVPADSVELAALYHDIGSAYKGLKQYTEARGYLDRALEIHQKLNRKALAASDLYMIASLYSKQGDYATAMDFAERALAQDKLVENSVGIGSDLFALGIISEKRQEETAAYAYYYDSLQVYRTLGMAPEVKELLSALARVAKALGRNEEAGAYELALKKMESAK